MTKVVSTGGQKAPITQIDSMDQFADKMKRVWDAESLERTLDDVLLLLGCSVAKLPELEEVRATCYADIHKMREFLQG